MFEISADSLKLALTQSKPFCSVKTSIPATEMFRLNSPAGCEFIDIHATDLDNTITVTLPLLAPAQREMDVLIPHSKALKIASLSAGPITFHDEGDHIIITSTTTRFQINRSFPVEDFPVNPYESENFLWLPEVPSEVLARIISYSVLPAPGTGEFRAHVTGTKVTAKDNAVSFCSTDSARLHLSSISLQHQVEKTALPAKTGLKSILPFLKSTDHTFIGFGSKSMGFKTENIAIYIRCLEGAFPETEDILNKARQYPRMLAGSNELKAAMTRLSVFDSPKVVMTCAGDNQIVMTLEHEFLGKIQETFKLPESGVPFEDLAINPKFLTESLFMSDETAIIGIKDNQSPVYINANAEALIMPIKA